MREYQWGFWEGSVPQHRATLSGVYVRCWLPEITARRQTNGTMEYWLCHKEGRLHLFTQRPLPHSAIYTHTHTFTLFIHQPGYVSWRVIAGLMCIHASWCVCVFTLSVGSVLSLPTLKPPSAPVFFLLPPPYPPPSLFPPLCAPIKDDWDLSKPSFLMSGLSIFFKGKNPVSFDNLALAEMSKQVEAEIKCMCNLKYIFCIQCFPALKHY